MDSRYFFLNTLSKMIYKSKAPVPRKFRKDIVVICEAINKPIKLEKLKKLVGNKDSEVYAFFRKLKNGK